VQLTSADAARGSLGDSCSIRPSLAERPLLGFVDAVKVMALFKMMANDTRIRIQHHFVRSGEVTAPVSGGTD
jgi:hypothetical protein